MFVNFDRTRYQTIDMLCSPPIYIKAKHIDIFDVKNEFFAAKSFVQEYLFVNLFVLSLYILFIFFKKNR